MLETFQTRYLRKLGLTKSKFNQAVHSGYFPAPETTRGKPRRLDFFDLLGMYVFALNVGLGIPVPRSGAIATALMTFYRQAKQTGDIMPSVRLETDENGDRFTFVAEGLPVEKGRGVKLEYDFAEIKDAIRSIVDELGQDITVERADLERMLKAEA